MREIKNEDRIISRILKGELSFSDRDFINLDKADLSEEREEQLSQLATEIQQRVYENKQLRKNVEQKSNTAESDSYTKLDLIVIEEELRSLREEQKRHTYYERGKKLLIGAGVTFAISLFVPIILSFFINSLLPILLASIVPYCVGVGVTMGSIKKSDKKLKQIKERIAKLEKERLDALDVKSENMIESDFERTKNIVNHIYKSKEIEMTDEEIKSMF